MIRRLVFVAALLLPAIALGAPTPVLIADQPIAVTGTFTSSGQGNTVGSTVALNGNSVCATVWLAGQPGAALDLASGTLTTTLTPSVSADATQSGNGCTGGTWTPTGFIDYVTGNTTPTLAVSSPNAGALLAVREGPAVCARVCTAASATTGTAQAFLLATQAKATLAPPADVTDRAGRLLGVVYGSQGQQLQQTATNFNLRSELAVGGTLIDPRAIRALTSADVVSAAQSGSWTVTTSPPANASTNLAQLAGTAPDTNSGVKSAGTLRVVLATDQPQLTNKLLVTPDSVALPANQSVNTSQINGVTPSMGNGVSGTGVQRVTLASDSTGQVAIATGSSTIGAVTAPGAAALALDSSVTGTQVAQGSTTSGQKGSLHQGAVTTAAPTYTTGQTSPVSLQTDGSQRVAVTNTPTVVANAGSGTFTVAGTVTTTPPSNASTNIAQVSGSTVSTAATGVQKVGVTGNAGAALDAAGQNATSPANSLLVGAQFNTTPTTISTGNMSPLQADSAGNLLVNIKAGGGTGGGPADTASNAAASESDAARQKVTSAIRVLDTGQSAGSQLVTAKGDQTSGMWVNCKAGCSAAGDTTGSQVTLGALNANALVALAGENSVTVQLTSSTSPVFTVVAECSLDSATTYGGTVWFVSSTGAWSSSLANPANGNYSLIPAPGCTGANNVRVRVSAYTSGSVVGQLRATSNSPGSAPYIAVVGANSYPAAGVALLAQDSSTATTSRAIKATANGVQVDPSGVTSPVSLASLPTLAAGTNLVGKVGLDQTTPGTTNAVSLAQVGATTVLTGNGTAGAGAQRVTIASDNTAFAVNATVSQATGTNLHAVLDTTSTTAVTQATASNLNAQVQGAAASGASKAGNPVQQGLVFNTSQPTVTTGQVVEAQSTARGAQIVATGADTFNVTVTSAPTTAVTIASLPALTTGAATIGAVTGPAAAALALDASVTGLEVAQASTTSGQKGVLIQGAVATSAPTLTNGQTSPLSLDTAGNVRMVWSGTGNIQGLGTAGAQSGGVLTVQGDGSGTALPVQTAGSTILAANAADRSKTATVLSTACTTTTSCATTAAISWSVAGAQSAELVVTAISTPVGITTACDLSYDGGTTYQLAKCVLRKSDPTSTGTVKTALANGDLVANTSWTLLWDASPSNVQVRLSLLTSGTVTMAGRAVMAPGAAPTIGAAIANGAPLNAAGSNIGQTMMAVDSATATTGRMLRADANGLLVSQATAANLNATVIGGVSNDTSAIAAGAETLPAVARASGTATTAGRAEKLQISSGAGGLFVEGPVANGATAAGNPLGMAGVGRATSAAPTQVTAGQSSALTTDLEHRLWVAAEHPNGFTCTVDAASASTQCVGLSGSGLSYYIKSVSFSASAAITMKVNSSTTAGNACATSPALVVPTSYMGVNTGGSFPFPNGYKVTANSALCCQPSGASGSCTINGYIAP